MPDPPLSDIDFKNKMAWIWLPLRYENSLNSLKLWNFSELTLVVKILLRVVQTQVILFLKSMSESVGSDIERLWNWMMNFKVH